MMYVILFLLTISCNLSSFAPAYQSFPVLEQLPKHAPTVSLLSALPRELLLQLTYYAMCNRGSHKNLEYIFDYFTPTEKEAKRIIGQYMYYGPRKDPYFFFGSLAPSPACQRLLQACVYYFNMGKKITTDIENSDISSLKIDLAPLDTPTDEHSFNPDAQLLSSIDLNQMFDDIHQEREHYRSSIDKCTTCLLDTPTCILFDWGVSFISLALATIGGIFIPSRISQFNWKNCALPLMLQCTTTPDLFNCSGSTNGYDQWCCSNYVEGDCKHQEIIFDQDHAWEQLIPWIPMATVLFTIVTVNACIVYIRLCHKPKPISPETHSLIQEYHQKIRRQNSDITEIV